MSRTVLTPADRKKAVAVLRAYHQDTFDALGIPDAVFIPKMAHYVKGATGLHMGFFESELNHGEDVYTEKVDINIESEDPNRVLYKVRNNPHFREEYFTPDPLPGKSMKYFVEVDEMEVIPRITKKARIKVKETPQQVEQVIIPNDPELDLPMEQMTMRDYACMKLGVPNTFKPWLNELIVTSNKMKEKSGR